MKRLMCVAAVLAAAISVVAASALAAGSPNGTTIYSSLISGGPRSNVPSVGAEAYAFNEFGNQINFSSSSARHLNSVTVTLSSWACVQGTWNNNNCSTPSGATFSQPMTLNIYSVGSDGIDVGTLLATANQTFDVPYRPSASPKCTGADAGKWYQSASKTCFNGLANNVTFNFAGNVTLPDTVAYGIAYNSSHHGYAPLGETACNTTDAGCPYDSLNIALANEPTDVSVGSDPHSGTIWQNSPYGGQYCDSGAAGIGIFRLDSPTSACWASYIPAVQFKARR
jgi:hypothetical protein